MSLPNKMTVLGYRMIILHGGGNATGELDILSVLADVASVCIAGWYGEVALEVAAVDILVLRLLGWCTVATCSEAITSNSNGRKVFCKGLTPLVITGLHLHLLLFSVHPHVDPRATVQGRIGDLWTLDLRNCLFSPVFLVSVLAQVAVLETPTKRLGSQSIPSTVLPSPAGDNLLFLEHTAIVKYDSQSHEFKKRISLLGSLQNLYTDGLIFLKMSTIAEVVKCRGKGDDSTPALHGLRVAAVSVVANLNLKPHLTNGHTCWASQANLDPG